MVLRLFRRNRETGIRRMSEEKLYVVNNDEEVYHG